MKLIVFLSLLCLSAAAQPNPINRRAMAIAGLAKSVNPTPCIASFTNPTQIAGLAYRWVAADGTNAGVLKDRIQANYWVQTFGPSQPVLHGNHLDFDGSASTFNTTNVTMTFENNCSFYLIVTVTNTGSDGWILSNNSNSTGDVRMTTGGAGGKFDVNGIPAGNTSFYPLQTLIDIVYAAQPSGHDKLATNGVVGDAFINTVTGTTYANVAGRAGDLGGKFKGAFYELGIYTNKTLSADEVCSLHYYATNTYGFTP